MSLLRLGQISYFEEKKYPRKVASWHWSPWQRMPEVIRKYHQANQEVVDEIMAEITGKPSSMMR